MMAIQNSTLQDINRGVAHNLEAESLFFSRRPRRQRDLLIAANGIACWAWCLCVCVHLGTHKRESTPAVGIGAKINSICEKAAVVQAAPTAAPLLFKKALRGRAINERAHQGEAQVPIRNASSHANFSTLLAKLLFIFHLAALIFQQWRRRSCAISPCCKCQRGTHCTSLTPRLSSTISDKRLALSATIGN